jgi:hypothetical protein
MKLLAKQRRRFALDLSLIHPGAEAPPPTA